MSWDIHDGKVTFVLLTNKQVLMLIRLQSYEKIAEFAINRLFMAIVGSALEFLAVVSMFKIS